MLSGHPSFPVLFSEYDKTSPVTIILWNLNEFKTLLLVLSALQTGYSFYETVFTTLNISLRKHWGFPLGLYIVEGSF